MNLPLQTFACFVWLTLAHFQFIKPPPSPSYILPAKVVIYIVAIAFNAAGANGSGGERVAAACALRGSAFLLLAVLLGPYESHYPYLIGPVGSAILDCMITIELHEIFHSTSNSTIMSLNKAL